MKNEDLAELLKVVGDKNRMNILCLLFRHQNLCVSEIANKLSLSIAITSHHLRTLESHGLLSSTKDGKEVCYLISNIKIMSDIKNLICSNLKIK